MSSFCPLSDRHGCYMSVDCWLSCIVGFFQAYLFCEVGADFYGRTGSTLVGGTIADLFESKDRGRPMSLFSFFAFVGTGAGPGYFYPCLDLDSGPQSVLKK